MNRGGFLEENYYSFSYNPIYDEDGKIASYKWEQTDGSEVDLKQADKQTSTFDVPESAADSKLVFTLTVVDDKGDSASDDLVVEVQKVAEENSN